jgi:hypothetical protein
MLDNLCSFDEEFPDDETLYIDETPRYSEPWHVILNRIVPHLLLEPFHSDESDVLHWNGWFRLCKALEKHGGGLSLPEGARTAQEVVPTELQHKLNVQCCFSRLIGGDLDEDPELFDEFLDWLRRERESVAYLNLTLNSLLRWLILPPRNRDVFTRMMQEEWGLSNGDEPLADYLSP